MDERERAERYRHAVIRPYICAGRTIFLLKTTSSSRWFPLSDVAYLRGASVKSETGRKAGFFFLNDLIPFSFFCSVFFYPPFFCFIAFAERNPISVF